LRELLDAFLLVSEDALKAATRLMIEKTRNLAEPAGAAALAALLPIRVPATTSTYGFRPHLCEVS
jgi:threonine dehydratase